MSLDTIITLYHSGALFCAGIVAVYLLLKWGTGTIPWLEEPQHAHYATAFLTALAVVAVPASQGTTPNASMLLVAAGTLLSLILPGLLPAAPTKPTPAIAPSGPSAPNGFVRLGALMMIATVGLGIACGAAQKAAEHTLATCTEDAAAKQLEPTVQSILTSGVDNWQAQLTALAVAFGGDELDCVVSFVKTLMTARQGASADTAAAIARADEWLRSHGK